MFVTTITVQIKKNTKKKKKKVLELLKSLGDCSYVRAFGQLSLRLTAIYTII